MVENTENTGCFSPVFVVTPLASKCWPTCQQTPLLTDLDVFIATRGAVRNIRCDRGFVGANDELRKLSNKWTLIVSPRF